MKAAKEAATKRTSATGPDAQASSHHSANATRTHREIEDIAWADEWTAVRRRYCRRIADWIFSHMTLPEGTVPWLSHDGAAAADVLRRRRVAEAEMVLNGRHTVLVREPLPGSFCRCWPALVGHARMHAHAVTAVQDTLENGVVTDNVRIANWLLASPSPSQQSTSHKPPSPLRTFL